MNLLNIYLFMQAWITMWPVLDWAGNSSWYSWINSRLRECRLNMKERAICSSVSPLIDSDLPIFLFYHLQASTETNLFQWCRFWYLCWVSHSIRPFFSWYIHRLWIQFKHISFILCFYKMSLCYLVSLLYKLWNKYEEIRNI